MSGLRVGVNALYLIPGGVGGTEIYLRQLLAAFATLDSADEFVVYTNRDTDAALVPQHPRFRHTPQPVSGQVRPARLAFEQTVLPWAVRRDRIDVLFNPGFTAPGWVPCPQVTVFHDLQHKRHPEHFRPADLRAWNAFLWLSARRSTRLVADSRATAADLARYYNVGPERVDVVPLGVGEGLATIPTARRLATAASPAPMLLCVSTLHPHKNLIRLVRVFSRFRARHPEWRLVLAGMRGFHAAAVEAAVGEFGVADAVTITGWIERSELLGLYRTATAAVYPSTFEGFGLPVLEALVAGVPLACSDIAPLLELIDNAAITFPPHDDDAMLAALEAVSRDPVVRARLATSGPARARLFTWERSATLTLTSLHRAVKSGSPVQ